MIAIIRQGSPISRRPHSNLGVQAWQALQAIAHSINLDYFGIDCALASNGDVVVFEYNVAMVVAQPNAQPQWAYRQPVYGWCAW